MLVEWPLTLTVAGDFASLSLPVIALALGLGLLPSRSSPSGHGERRAGVASPPPGVAGAFSRPRAWRYNATSFAGPYKRIFDFVYRPRRRLEVDYHPDSRFFVRRMAYENLPRGLAEEWLYAPVARALQHATARVRAIQSGSANLYLIYVLAALLVLLVLA